MRRFPEADAVIFGHSHLPLHEAREGFQVFNPGSPTERRRARPTRWAWRARAGERSPSGWWSSTGGRGRPDHLG